MNYGDEIKNKDDDDEEEEEDNPPCLPLIDQCYPTSPCSARFWATCKNDVRVSNQKRARTWSGPTLADNYYRSHSHQLRS